jgi:hypothetical protein
MESMMFPLTESAVSRETAVDFERFATEFR